MYEFPYRTPLPAFPFPIKIPMEKETLLLAYRHMIKDVSKWLSTPEFRRKLTSNLSDIYRMQVTNPAEMLSLGKSAFQHLSNVRPKTLEALGTYMRTHEVRKVTISSSKSKPTSF